MKQNLLSLVAIGLLLPMTLAGQETTSTDANSGSQNVSPFTQSSKRFNDWSISAGAGVPLIQSADMTSIKNGNGKNLFGLSNEVNLTCYSLRNRGFFNKCRVLAQIIKFTF